MRLIDAEELGFRILEETSDTDETANKIYGLVINAPTIEPSLVGAEMSLPEYLEDSDIVKHENDMVTMNYNTYQDLLEPKRGRWIEDAKTYYEELNKRELGVDEYTPYFIDDIACSECLAKYSTIDNETQFFKFCPNCGARMENEDE